MDKASRIMLKILAMFFFLLAVAAVLATLLAASGSSRSPGLFLAVILAGLGKWLLGKSQGKSAQQMFGRAIDVAETDDALETPHDGRMKIQERQQDIAGKTSDGGKSTGSN